MLSSWRWWPFADRASDARDDPACRRVIVVQHTERLSFVPGILALMRSIAVSGGFQVAVPYIGNGSLMDALDRHRPLPLSTYVVVDAGFHSQCKHNRRRAVVQLRFARRTQPPASAHWCGNSICIPNWTPCTAEEKRRLPRGSCPRHNRAPLRNVSASIAAAFALFERNLTLHAGESRSAVVSQLPTLIMPDGATWYKDVQVPSSQAFDRRRVIRALSPGLRTVVTRIEAARLGCRAARALSLAGMMRIVYRGKAMRINTTRLRDSCVNALVRLQLAARRHMRAAAILSTAHLPNRSSEELQALVMHNKRHLMSGGLMGGQRCPHFLATDFFVNADGGLGAQRLNAIQQCFALTMGDSVCISLASCPNS